MIYIYGLLDPFTFKIRYIGKSIRPKERLANQCNEKSNTYRSHWIQSLLKKGKKPIQVILQELPDGSNWQHSEKKWIAIARKYGWDLVNCTDGGDGVENLSGESKERMLKTWKGRKHTPETIEKLKNRPRRKHSEEHKSKMSELMQGRVITWSDKLKVAVRKFDDTKIEQVKEDLKTMMVKDVAAKHGVHRTTITKIKLGTYLQGG